MLRALALSSGLSKPRSSPATVVFFPFFSWFAPFSPIPQAMKTWTLATLVQGTLIPMMGLKVRSPCKIRVWYLTCLNTHFAGALYIPLSSILADQVYRADFRMASGSSLGRKSRMNPDRVKLLKERPLLVLQILFIYFMIVFPPLINQYLV